MRYTEAENPYIICRFTTGDTVTIDIYDLSDSSKLIDGVGMTEIGSTGYFKYQFNPNVSSLKEYMYVADNTIEEHAGKIILGGYPDGIKDQTDKMNFTGTDIKATLDSEEVTTNTASRTASKADVTNLDVAVSTRNATTPPTVGQIKTELEGVGTKLTAVKDKTDTINWTDITFLKNIEGGKWQIVGNSMVFYESDNATEVARFNLFGQDGNPTMTNVYKRERA